MMGLRSPKQYLTQLESLRGWAITLVVCFHTLGLTDGQASAYGLSSDAPLWLRLAGAGNTGVTLFFVLSGFLLALPFLHALRAGGRVSIARFYAARLLRILPLYYAVILISWLVSGNDHSALKALLFVPVGFEIFPFSVPWWSLSTEMQFYLLLPWIMWALAWPMGRALILVALLVWASLHVVYLLQPEWLGLPRRLWLESSVLGRGFAFLIGGLAAWLHLNRDRIPMPAVPHAATLVGGALLAAQLWLLQWYGLMGQKPALQAMPLFHDLEALLWGGLLLCSLAPLGRIGRLFINPIFNHLGTISYSLYLVHLPIQFYLIYPVRGNTTGPADLSNLAVLTAVIGSVGLSWLVALVCYQLIEQPFLRLKSHIPVLSGRRPVTPARV